MKKSGFLSNVSEKEHRKFTKMSRVTDNIEKQANKR